MIVQIYTINKLCVYLELFIASTGDTAMLYIPSKYDIPCNDNIPSQKIKYIDITESGSIIEDSTEEADTDKIYENVILTLDSQRDISDQIASSYKKDISLSQTTSDNSIEIKEIFRQLKRLRLCVENIRYKICIFYKSFICCIRRDDSLECFQTVETNNSHNSHDLRFAVTLDLELFYDKIDNIVLDIKTVRHGIYSVLDKSQRQQTAYSKKMLEIKVAQSSKENEVIHRIQKLDRQIDEVETLLNDLNNTSRNIPHEALEQETQLNTNGNNLGIYGDIEKTKIQTQATQKLAQVKNLQQDTMKLLYTIKAKREDLALRLDRIGFDNIVILNSLSKNFQIFASL